MPKQNKNKALWEKEFDKKFNLEGFCNYKKTDFRLNFVKASEVKAFIKSLLNKQRVRDREEMIRAVDNFKLYIFDGEGNKIGERRGGKDYEIMEQMKYQFYDTLKSYKLKKNVSK